MSEEIAVRIAEGVERVGRVALAIEYIGAAIFSAICLALILWALNR